MEKIIKFTEFIFEDVNDDVDKTDSTTEILIKNRLTDFNKKLTYYKSNKGKIDSLLKNNTSNKDISNDLKKIVDKNEFLIKYLEIANLEQSLTKLENKIDDTNTLIKNKQTSMSELASIKDPATKAEETKKINDSISEMKNKIVDYNKKIQEVSKSINDKKKALDLFIKDTQTKIQKDINNLKI